MPLNLGDQMPNFEVDTTIGKIKFHDWLGDSWGILFSHPADYTPVCTTELGKVEELMPEFQKRGIKVIALSCDSVESHKGWIEDIKAYNNLSSFSYPIIADPERKIATELGMIDPDEKDSQGLPLTCRAVFILGPGKKSRRNFSEVLRVIDSLHLTAHKKVATPVNWENGGNCMVIPSISKEEASKLFPKHEVKAVPSKKEYIRVTPQP
eukprot:gene15617-17188_t